MTKAELVAEISRNTGVQRDTVLAVVEEFMTTVKDTVANGDNVCLRGFGTFELKKRAAKTARNISKNTIVNIPARNIPYFKPAREFKEAAK
jgi:DNA-binding protein HU-beta